MGGTRSQIRRGSKAAGIPAIEHLAVGQQIWDADLGALGIGAGEQQPRWAPGIDENGHMILHEGQRITSLKDKTTYIEFRNSQFIVVIDGKQTLVIGENNDAIFDSVTLSDTLRFKILETLNYPEQVGFSFRNGRATFTCPVDFLGPLNLSLQDFANSIIPTDFNPNDVFTAGTAGTASHSWKSPATLVKNLSPLAPLLHNSISDVRKTMALKFSEVSSFYGANANGNGSLDDDLLAFLIKYGSSFNRLTPGYYFNRKAKYTKAEQGVPRVEYDPYTGRCLGLLIEGDTTNLDTDSSSMSGWESNGLSPLPVSRGTWTALGLKAPYSLSEQANGEHYTQRTHSNVAKSRVLSVSRFVEMPFAANVLKFQMMIFDSVNRAGVTFTISDQEMSGSPFQAGRGAVLNEPFIQRITNKIFRVGFTCVMDTTSNTNQVITNRLQMLNPAGVNIYEGTRSDIFYTNESQVETSDRVTSYIPTAGSTANRRADMFSLDLSNGNFSYDQFRNSLNFKLFSRQLIENDPVFSLSSPTYEAQLRAGTQKSLVQETGVDGNKTTTTVVTNATDFVIFNFDCTGVPSNAVSLNVGANKDQTKFFNGWLNYLTLTKD